MGLILFIVLFACLCVYTTNSKICYNEQLAMDRCWDRPCVCNDARKYPELEIETALSHSSEDNHMFLYTVTNAYDENNYFMDSYLAKGEYSFHSLCKSKIARTQIFTVKKQDNNVCFVVRPDQQNIFFSECRGKCKLGYGSVPGYHCIPRGFTERSFLVYCPKKNIPCGQQNALPGFIEPTGSVPSLPSAKWSPPDVPVGTGYNALGYFCKVTVVLPTYCGCRGYFCNF